MEVFFFYQNCTHITFRAHAIVSDKPKFEQRVVKYLKERLPKYLSARKQESERESRVSEAIDKLQELRKKFPSLSASLSRDGTSVRLSVTLPPEEMEKLLAKLAS